jgi:two-component sensor histidine kinase/PAS domain-containing protein
MQTHEVDLIANAEDLPGICAWNWHVAENRLYWSPKLCELHGVPLPPADPGEYLLMIHPADRERVAREREEFLQDGDTFDHEFRIVRPDGSVRFIVDRGQTFRDASGGAVRLEGVNIDVTDLRMSADAQRSAERRAAFAARIGGLVTWEISVESGQIIAEEGLPQLFGIAGAAPAAMAGYIERIHVDDAPVVLESFARAGRGEGRYDAEFRVLVNDDWRWLKGAGEAVEVDGTRRVVGFNRDISEERRQREQLDTVAREMSHRVKNAFAVMQALARQTFRKSEAAEVAVFEGRLNALARSQDLVVRRAGRPASLSDLIDAVVCKPLGQPERLCIAGPDVSLTERTSLALALIFHELLTNALKYGALSNEKGVVHIDWSLEVEEARLLWRESGGPGVVPPLKRGFGSRLIGRVITADVGGRAELKFEPEGVQCEIRWPSPPAS